MGENIPGVRIACSKALRQKRVWWVPGEERRLVVARAMSESIEIEDGAEKIGQRLMIQGLVGHDKN